MSDHEPDPLTIAFAKFVKAVAFHLNRDQLEGCVNAMNMDTLEKPDSYSVDVARRVMCGHELNAEILRRVDAVVGSRLERAQKKESSVNYTAGRLLAAREQAERFLTDTRDIAKELEVEK